MSCQTCGSAVGDDGRCTTCAAPAATTSPTMTAPPAPATTAPAAPASPAGARPAWLGVLDVVRTGLVGPVVVAGAALLGMGDETGLNTVWTLTVVAACALLLLGAMADHRRGAGRGTGLLSGVPQALAAAYVVSAAALAWDGSLVPIVLAVGAALVAADAVRRLRRGDLGPLRSVQGLRAPLVTACLLVAALGLWGMHGEWWTVDSSLGGGYQYQYGYDGYTGEYGYSYEWSPTASYNPGGSGGVGEDDAYVVIGGVGLLVAAFAVARRDLQGRARWLPLAALAAPAAYLAWSMRLTSGYGAMVSWNYELAGYGFALAGVVLAAAGSVAVRRSSPADGEPASATAVDPSPPPPF